MLKVCHLQNTWQPTGMHVAEGLLSMHVGALQDMARVARWMAGKAVGLVLSGGGSRGLAHLGVLHALDDAGVPIDVIGGTSQVSPPCPALEDPDGQPTSLSTAEQPRPHLTFPTATISAPMARNALHSARSFLRAGRVFIGVVCAVQGAFMAALYAQGLAWERMHEAVREYAGAMGSVRHLLSDLTLPIISVFSGAGFDRVIRQSFQHGAQRIEDLWLRWGPHACDLPVL